MIKRSPVFRPYSGLHFSRWTQSGPVCGESKVSKSSTVERINGKLRFRAFIFYLFLRYSSRPSSRDGQFSLPAALSRLELRRWRPEITHSLCDIKKTRETELSCFRSPLKKERTLLIHGQNGAESLKYLVRKRQYYNFLLHNTLPKI